MNKQEVLQKIEKVRAEFFKLATDPKQTIDIRSMGHWISTGAAVAISVIEELNEKHTNANIDVEKLKDWLINNPSHQDNDYPDKANMKLSNVEETIKKIDELRNKLVVPKFLDEYMKENEGEHAADIFSGEWLYEEPNVLEEKVAKWLLNDETEENNRRYLIAVQAFVTGDYEVEKEPLYYVKIPSLAYDMFLVKGEGGELIVFQNTSCGTKFTEAEIKAIDERYWAFAVPVEEVAER